MVIAVWSFPEKGCIKLCGGGLDKGYRNYHITPSNEGQSSCLVCAATKLKKLGILQTITGMANLSKKVMKFDGPFFENRHFEPVQAQCSTGPASVSRGKSRARVRPRIAPDFLRKLFTSRQNLRHPSLHAGRHGLKWTGKSSEQNLPDPHFWVMFFFWHPWVLFSLMPTSHG